MHTPSDEDSTLDPAAEFILEEDVVTQVLATWILAETLPDRLLLTSREKLVLMGRYEGKTLQEIGDSMGVTESRACQLWTSVCKKLREEYEF
jgi:DNA-directed RNA polymerase specialized sigma subunit